MTRGQRLKHLNVKPVLNVAPQKLIKVMPPTSEVTDNYDYLLDELNKQEEYNEYLRRVNKLEVAGHSNLLDDMYNMSLDVEWARYFDKIEDLSKLPKLNLSALDKSKPLPNKTHFRGKSLSIEELIDKVDRYNSELEEQIDNVNDPFEIGIATPEGFKEYDEDDCLDYLLSIMEEDQGIPFESGEPALLSMWLSQGSILNGAWKIPVNSGIKASKINSSEVNEGYDSITTTTTTTVKEGSSNTWNKEDFTSYPDLNTLMENRMKRFLKSGFVKNNGH